MWFLFISGQLGVWLPLGTVKSIKFSKAGISLDTSKVINTDIALLALSFSEAGGVQQAIHRNIFQNILKRLPAPKAV